MTRETRKLLLITLTILFVIVGSGLVLYSRGIRLDTKNWDLVRTGGIYIKSDPVDVEINLDGRKVKNKTGIIQSGTLINNLKPGAHRVILTKEGYSSWEKEVTVVSSIVASYEGVILWPKREAVRVTSTVDNFYIRDDSLVVQKGNRISLDQKPIIGNKMVYFTPGGTLVTYQDDTKTYYLVGIANATSSINLSNTFNRLRQKQLGISGTSALVKVVPYSYNDRKLIVMTAKGALYSLDTERDSLDVVSPAVKDFVVTGDGVIFWDKEGLFNFNLIFRNKSQISLPVEITSEKIKELIPSPSGDLIAIVKDNHELILLERATGKLEKLSEGVTRALFSYNGKKLAYLLSNNQVGIYEKKDGESEMMKLSPKNEGGIKEMTWHKNNNYLFVEDRGGHLYFLETDDSPPLNQVEIASQVKNFTYSKDNDVLYFNNTGGIWRFKLKE